MTPQTTEELRVHLVTIMQDVLSGKISAAVARAQTREANKTIRKLRLHLASAKAADEIDGR